MDQPSKMDLRAGPFLSAITGDDATREDDTTGAGPAMRLRPKEAATASISAKREEARCSVALFAKKNAFSSSLFNQKTAQQEVTNE